MAEKILKEEVDISIKRHSLSHVLAYAIRELYPNVKLAIGPAIDNGFYYDLDLGDAKIGETELKEIEKKMAYFIKQNLKFEKSEISIAEAIKREEGQGEIYKAEILNDLKAQGETVVSYYQVGSFQDLCRGPHIVNTNQIKPGSYRLDKLAGAYWRGDEKNQMLTRIYGLAFETREELDDYLKMVAEAEKRDHRKLGKELNLFIFSDLVGKGLPLWTEKGSVIRRELERFIVDEEIKRGYRHVYTPDIARLELYKTSGHYPYYKDSMYAPIKIDEDEFMLRPMTCPHHFELYKSKQHSYRDMPVRIAELAKLYRYEQSGELTGLIRVRNFCLADAHIVARLDQAEDEINRALDLIEYAVKVLGFEANKDYRYRLSLGDRSDEAKYYKDDAAWENAEAALRNVLKGRAVDSYEAAGEAAFYGPKIDIQMKNVFGKEDTAFTVQYDFVMPKRFNLEYTNEDGKAEEPIVIHRSSIGAIERIIAFIIEKYAGAFPLWLSPVQVQLIAVGESHVAHCQKLAEELRVSGIRSEVDGSDLTVGNKIRKAVNEKIPYMLVIGDKEVDSSSLSVRVRGSQDTVEYQKDAFIQKLVADLKSYL
ncbi:MAG: threonine--tRNA ligase [Patescibacteria group bacterium]